MITDDEDDDDDDQNDEEESADAHSQSDSYFVTVWEVSFSRLVMDNSWMQISCSR